MKDYDNWERRHRWAILAAGILCLVVAALLATATEAEAHDHQGTSSVGPYGGCKEAWQAPQSRGADYCRSMGWQVGARFLVAPKGVFKFSSLPSCKYEDGSGQPLKHGNRNCSWNVRATDGNGCGKAYLVLGKGADRGYVDLRRWRDGERVPYWRAC